ncbi:hypothetical protein [Halomicrobium salinisoli]|uniref:hypothetical protein n=1 Tax=Halomicrobium salinisoli TaxID=2878391 RepID=UPI001CF09CE5|nr:hypothetical protein [Halomicrobium salinisoli]
MAGESSDWFGDADDDPRARAVRMLFIALTTTMTLALSSVDTFSLPAEMSGVAVSVGAVCGAAVSILVESTGEPLLSGYSELLVLVAIGAPIVVLWWVLSWEGLRAFALGSVAFVWMAALSDATRNLLLPRLADRD